MKILENVPKSAAKTILGTRTCKKSCDSHADRLEAPAGGTQEQKRDQHPWHSLGNPLAPAAH